MIHINTNLEQLDVDLLVEHGPRPPAVPQAHPVRRPRVRRQLGPRGEGGRARRAVGLVAGWRVR